MADVTSLGKKSRKQARRASKKAAPVASDARDSVVKAAGSSYDWAAPKVEATMEWAAPKLEATKDWAAPHVETAADWAAPHVGTAKDWAAPRVETAAQKVKDDVLPRVAEAVAAAFAASEPAREEAKTRGTAAIAALRGELDPPPSPRRRRVKRWFMFLTVSGAAVAGWKVWHAKNTADRPEPWVTPWPESPPTPAVSGTQVPAVITEEPLDESYDGADDEAH
jgi:Family of unknown function (DUF5324)